MVTFSEMWSVIMVDLRRESMSLDFRCLKVSLWGSSACWADAIWQPIFYVLDYFIGMETS